MIATITPVYASLLGLLFVYLSYRAVTLRRSALVPLGHGTNKPLRRAVRVHGNAAEYLPLILLLMLLFEINGGAHWELHIYGIATLTGRVLHAFWLSRITGRSFGRHWGTVLTWAVLVSLSLANLRLYIFN